jgi:hypothetical protein
MPIVEWARGRAFLWRHSGQAKREAESRVPCTRNELDSRFRGNDGCEQIAILDPQFSIFGALTHPNVLWFSTIS